MAESDNVLHIRKLRKLTSKFHTWPLIDAGMSYTFRLKEPYLFLLIGDTTTAYNSISGRRALEQNGLTPDMLEHSNYVQRPYTTHKRHCVYVKP